MRKVLVLMVFLALTLTGCNTFKGTVNGMGRDFSAVGRTLSI